MAFHTYRPAGSGLSVFEQLVHLVDEIAEMKRLREHPRILWGGVLGVKRDGGEACDEHDLEIRIELARPARQLDAIHPRHHDICKQEREGLFFQPLEGIVPILKGDNLVPSAPQRALKEPPHRIIIFRQKNPALRQP